MNRLPVTGSNQLLDLLDPFIPDDFINERWNVHPIRGPRWQFSPAQLWRVHLLPLLTPVHSLNLLTRFLPEQRALRNFARLRHRHRTPTCVSSTRFAPAWASWDCGRSTKRSSSR
jgi:hypothetical protein